MTETTARPGRRGRSGWPCRWPGRWSRTWPSSTARASARCSCAAPTSTPGEVDQVLVPCGHTLALGLPVVCGAGSVAARGAVPGGLAPRGRTRHRPRTRPPRTSSGGSCCAPRPSSNATRRRRPGRTPPTWTRSSPSWTRRSPRRASAGKWTQTALRGGTAPPGAARMPRTCPAARSAPARSARPTPRRTARRSARRCSSR